MSSSVYTKWDGTVVSQTVEGVDEELDTIYKMISHAQSGDIKLGNYWTVGDTRTLSLKASGVIEAESVTVVIEDLDSFTSGGTPYNVQFGLLNGLTGQKYMNSADTNVGSWRDTYMRNTVMADFDTAFANSDSSLSALIKPACIISGHGDATNKMQSTHDRWFLKSEYEVHGETIYAGSEEADTCKQLALYKTKSYKVKKEGNSRNAYAWWLRSPNVFNTAKFCVVTGTGSANWFNANNTYLVAPSAIA